MKYTLLEQTTGYQGFFRLDVSTIRHDRFDGGELEIKREYLERGDAVVVLLFDPALDEVLLIEQFRVGPVARDDHPWLIEVVAGMLHPGEDPLDCARRECIEEAGYEPAKLTPLGSYYVSPGGCSEKIHLYLSEVDRSKPVGTGGGLESEHEDIRVFWVSRAEALAMVEDGRINSSGPMLALLLAFPITS
ncbi:MAG: DNA mismatch repair protein MutT [Zetaproteobacteria bacterium CG06_land_8_20_14_3_00_59_53]|nr:MAG: DNA mismatch repair protein MutT [Zetaproteobacteria bacterium CG2_30_59_37]PIO89178.1 MAG: DNA mismatch repair protein MutT [Zetaproteobacteria bacterium CG23_combo_of_CG06-09_8_20_14_all_59_86]PIQ64489.1 MAG: DNA mismatch repair protein MutT [Zetaproteobacteria bacterium CG11_big_fil_rev_8_21_14_0_20_59_439]PIU70916.1 MAG: DNA mismatch repair protein MutT [Zetaproteobacteria bacterium CG06_land_8_20_14_3_00_59_53]PIU96355.1 MAG: DNA mismatch repair protein MutT [Zetaproteobacteria bac